MPKNHKLTPRAERDLKDIWLYTAEAWSDEQAEIYVASLEKQFEALADSPYMGAARPDIEQGYRYFPEGKHLIFYRVENETIVILAVPHASMDIERLMEREQEKTPDDDREPER